MRYWLGNLFCALGVHVPKNNAAGFVYCAWCHRWREARPCRDPFCPFFGIEHNVDHWVKLRGTVETTFVIDDAP